MKAIPLIMIMPLMLGGLFTLQGCVTMPTQSMAGAATTPVLGAGAATDGNLSSAERAIRDENAWFTGSDMEACAIGGVLTGLAAGVATGDRRIGVIGAAAGCALGIGANKYLQSLRNQFASEEELKQKLIADAKQENEKLRLYVVQANEVIAADQKTIASIKKQMKKKKFDLAKAKQQMQKVDANLATLQKNQVNWKGRLNTLQETARAAPSPDVDREIVQLNRQFTALDKAVNTISTKRELTKV